MPILPPPSDRTAVSLRKPGDAIIVGLVNNMPDKALRSTERQFRELLGNSAGDLPVVLRVFSLPDLPRSDEAKRHVHDHHEPIDHLWSADIDGLIVTGTEPRAADMTDEPYWPALTELVDWAADRTITTAWSCLAAHAAVRYLDGIDRRPLATKLSGVFECTRTAADHPLTRHGAARWSTPHSRHNELAEDDLRSHGYQILGRSATAGVDLFAKRRGSLFLFLQGHPEYDADALFREYRRDVGRFLAGERPDYPEMPEGYFDNGAADAMLAFRMLALRERNPDLLSCFPMATQRRNVSCAWQKAAVSLYGNWLGYLAAEKRRRLGSRTARRALRTELMAAVAYG